MNPTSLISWYGTPQRATPCRVPYISLNLPTLSLWATPVRASVLFDSLRLGLYSLAHGSRVDSYDSVGALQRNRQRLHMNRLYLSGSRAGVSLCSSFVASALTLDGYHACD